MRAMTATLLVVLAGGTLAGAGDVSFTTPPTASRVGEKVKVTFAVSAPTDVEVAVLDAEGKVVHHLAAGVLGGSKPPPEPLQPGLSQALEWDGADDLGKPAGGGPFQIRVRLGLRPAFSHLMGECPETHGGVVGLGCDADGRLYVLYRFGGLSHHYTSMAIKVYGRDGKYLRQVMPYPADLSPEKRRGVKQIELADGPPVPLVFHGHSRGLYPETGAGYRHNIVLTAAGKLAITSHPFDAPSGITARRVLLLGTDGSVGADYLGPKIIRGKAAGWIMLALSPDEKTIYLSGARTRRGPVPAVLRTRWGSTAEPEVFVGDEARPGGGPESLAEPRGIATDADGNVYVCDHMNDRVSVFSAAGKPLAQLPAPSADLAAIHPKTGAIYVLTCKSRPDYNKAHDKYGSGANFLDKKLLKFAGYKLARPVAVLDMSTQRTARPQMALDASADPPVIWMAGLKWGDGRIRKVLDRGDRFELAGAPIADRVPEGALGAGWLDVAVDRHSDQILVGDSSRRLVGAKRYDGLTGKYLGRMEFKSKMARGYWGEAAFSWDGQRVFYATPLEKHYLFDRKGSPVSWPGRDTNQVGDIPEGFIHPRGHAPAPDGSFYVLHHDKHRAYERGRVSQVDAAGNIVRKEFIKLDAPVGGVKVDLKGNVYVGAHVRPRGQNLPPWFTGKMPGKQLPWYTHMYGSILKFRPSGGAVAFGPGRFLAGPGRKPASATGLTWAYYGVAPMPSRKASRCSCQVPRFDVDPYGRVFLPDAFRFSVVVLDGNANPIARFGGYGNADSRGPGGPIKTPAIPFGWVHSIQVTDRNAYVADVVNHRIVGVKLGCAAEQVCAIK